LHGRGLAGAVGAEEPEQLAALDREADAVDGDRALAREPADELLAQVLDLEHGGGHRRREDTPAGEADRSETSHPKLQPRAASARDHGWLSSPWRSSKRSRPAKRSRW